MTSTARTPFDLALLPQERRIAHLDMDAFFASVELLRYPQLQGLPVVIGGSKRKAAAAFLPEMALADFTRLKDYAGRGVVTTATYAARKFGIGSAMGLMKAAKLCPEAVILPVDFDEIRRCAALFKQAIATIAPVVEDRGIDEVYIDLTHVPGAEIGGGLAVAQRISQAVFAATGLTCSIGVAPNKLLAKIASELNKPNGIAILHMADVQSTVWPLACRKINGIGPKADAKLAGLGITTVGQLAAQPLELLVAHFGKASGAWLHEAAWGRDQRPVQTHSEPVSMSRETTFERDLHPLQDRQELGQILTGLCTRLAGDLQRKGFVARTIGIKLRYADFTIATRDSAAPQATQSAEDIRQVARQCLKRVPLEQRLRLLGIRASGLVKLGEAAQNPLDTLARQASLQFF